MLLLHYDIKPIMVFDGQHLPAKAQTEQRRRESRQLSKKRAIELLRLGKTEEARSHFRRCIDVTHEMALKLIKECRKLNVDCIVAPYEADAQMAWLQKVNIAQYIITEDSDLMLFGAKKVIFKLDLNGCGLLIEADKLYKSMGCNQEKYSFEKFRRMCILSGCDYLDSLPGIGLMKACKFILKTEQDDMCKVLKRIPQYLNMRNLEVTDEYIVNFLKAEATFRHMYIFNPLERRMERLNALTEYNTDERLCCNAGSLIDDTEKALQLALGNLNPFTSKQMDNWHPDNSERVETFSGKKLKSCKHKSIWKPSFTPNSIANTNEQRELCAFSFKKITINKKALKDEMAAIAEVENSKLKEEDVINMYSSAEKRRHSSSDDEACSEIECTSPTKHTENIARLKCNPFAKKSSLTEEDQTSPSVCKNASLLRLLSPAKAKQPEQVERDRRTPQTNSIRRNLSFQESSNSVPVRSRFFANNQTEFKKNIQQMRRSKTELSTEIVDNEIEATNLQIKQAASHSSIKKTAEEHNAPQEFDNITQVIHNIEDEVDETLNSELNPTQTFKQADSIAKKLNNFKIGTARRMGLCKPKTARKSTTFNNKVIATKAATEQGQTRLSMFGFQKRAVLK